METVMWQWGPFSIAVFSLSFFSAVLIGLVLIFAEGRRKLLPDQRVIDFLVLVLVSGVAGSRLMYALFFEFEYFFRENPVHLFRLQDGGLSFWGGLLTALIIVLFWSSARKLIIGRYLDIAAPALCFALALGSVGIPLRGVQMTAQLPWGVARGEYLYHPDGAYAIILLMVLYYVIFRRRERAVNQGELFNWFLFGYAIINLITDFFRVTDPTLANLSAGQALSVMIIVVTLFMIISGIRPASTSPYMSRNIHGQKHGLVILLQLCWLLVLTGGMVALYYLANKPVSL